MGVRIPLLPSLLEPERASFQSGNQHNRGPNRCATSCAAIYESLCRHSASLSGRAPTKRRHEIDSSVKAFLADTRIAGYVEREDGSERPLYLDHGLYVPRQAAEEPDRRHHRTVRERLAGEVGEYFGRRRTWQDVTYVANGGCHMDGS